MIDTRTDDEVRADLLRIVRAAKARLKAEFGATSAEARVSAQGMAKRMMMHAVEVLKLGELGACQVLFRLGVITKRGELTPEYGGPPEKIKPKKKKRK